MGRGKILVIVGVIIGVFGLIFHLQGQAVVGPESSFMYANTDWITLGTLIGIVGIIISCLGVIPLKRN